MVKFVLALFCFTTSLISQATWFQEPVPLGPNVTMGAGAYSMQDQRTVLFGGKYQGTYTPGSPLTKIYDDHGWVDGPPGPSFRMGHRMAYDWLRATIVMFGGSAGINSQTMAETWEFASGSWNQIFPGLVPSARYDHSMSYDVASGKILMFGGRRFLAASLQTLSDTWWWDGAIWTQAQVPGPAPRFGHAMAYDLSRQRTILFGGGNQLATGIIQYNDTWEFDGLTWNSAASGGLLGRVGHALVYDLNRGKLLLHGGYNGANETWEWDGVQWSNVTIGGGHPLMDHVLVYNTRINRVLALYGTSTITGPALGEVWSYGPPIQGSYITFGTSGQGTIGMPQLFESSSTMTGPIIGETSILTVTNTPWHTFFLFGWSNSFDGNLPLPLSLSLYGMQGSLYVSRDFTTSRTPILNNTTISMVIPYEPTITSVVFYIQAFTLDLGNSPSCLIPTNGITATVGRN